MKLIKCKFVCGSVEKTSFGTEIVRLSACSSGKPEDNSYAEATPSATVELHVTNRAAHGTFVAGKSFYATFHPEEESPALPGLVDSPTSPVPTSPVPESAPSPAPTPVAEGTAAPAESTSTAAAAQ